MLPVEADIVNFRYFDANGRELTSEQLRAMEITTPAMEHVFAAVAARTGKLWNRADRLEEQPERWYH